MPLRIVRNNIAQVKADIIVNTANPQPIVGRGVDSAIHAAAGEELLCARQAIGEIRVGDAVITPAFHLPAKYVIHAVGSRWQGGKQDEVRLLESCYMRALELAGAKRARSIAFPLMASGYYGFPKDIALKTALHVIEDYLMEHDMLVELVVFDAEAYVLSRQLFADVASYIDDNFDEPPDSDGESGHGDRLISLNFAEVAACEESLPPLFSKSVAEAPRSLEDLMDETEDTWAEALLRLIDRKGFTDAEVYKRANVDRRLFSKIRNHPEYQPSKNTAVAFALALRLNLDETLDFIGRAGFTLTHSSKSDIVVEYFIEKEEYDIHLINITLLDFKLPAIA